MNHEILFRGFHKEENGKETIYIDGQPIKGKWFFGSLIYDINKKWYIHENNCALCIGFHEVITKTIGQYCGLDDMNGKKIFEKDKVYYYHKTFFKRKGKEIYDYKKEKCYVLWDKELCGYILNKSPNKLTERNYIDPLMESNDKENIEVIGTIFDKEVNDND